MAESISDGHLSIGEVLGVLLQEFPDVTISKIRFLESQGLIAPERTPSGYRKFYSDDVDLLRVILTEQRENYLPLRVIKDRLDSGEIDPTGEHLRPVLGQVASVDEATSAEPASAVPDSLVSEAVAPEAADSEVSRPNPSDSSSLNSEATRPSPDEDAPPKLDKAARSEAPPQASAPVPPPRALTTVPSPGVSSRPAELAPVSAGENQLAELRARSTAMEPSDAGDDDPSGEVPVTSVASHPAARSAARRDERRAASPRLLPGVMLDAAELCGMVGITRAQLDELEGFGIIVGREVIGGKVYTEDAVEIAKPAGALLRAGVDSRHLRAWRTAAEREASLYEQLIAPRLRQRNPEARADAMAQLRELEATGDALHDALVRSALRPHFDA